VSGDKRWKRFLDAFHRDPAARQQYAEILRGKSDVIAEFRRHERPVLDALREEGVVVDELKDLEECRTLSDEVVGVLIHALSEASHSGVKQVIVGVLRRQKLARNTVCAALVAELEKARSEQSADAQGLMWSYAEALEKVIDAEHVEPVAAMVLDEEFGDSRQMLALALGRHQSVVGEQALIQLLSDPEAPHGHAIAALGKLRCSAATELIEPFLSHPKAWVRKEASKALRRIQKHR